MVDTLAGGQILHGMLSITSFGLENVENHKCFKSVNGHEVPNGRICHLVASGTLTGTVTDAAGKMLGTTNTIFQNVPANLTDPAQCAIVTLNLGAIHLDLLGLVVDLAPVNLNVNAVPGPGNLLGNLLCAVTNLLNGAGSLAALNNLLTTVNNVFSGLLAAL